MSKLTKTPSCDVSRRRILQGAGAIATGLLLGTESALAADSCVSSPFSLPSTTSAGWTKIFSDMGNSPKSDYPAADDLSGWDALRLRLNVMFTEMNRERVAHTGVRLHEDTLGGVPVLWVEPPKVRRKDCLIVYTHGGAYTLASAGSTALTPANVAVAAGCRAISIDYTLAPRARWDRTTEEVEKVFAAIYAKGYSPERVACFGESAGGGLTAGALLRMRDRHIPLPAAAVLWSPWTDLDFQGDSLHTLAAADLQISLKSLLPCRDAYVAAADRRHPYASPVYGDFSKGFPPTLIQCGLREALLSDSVRLYQAMDTAGVDVRFDPYEAMPHIHQIQAPETPEAQLAIAKTVRFLIAHMGG